MRYLVKTPWWLKMIYRQCLWEMPAAGNKVYLSFDDGPHEQATPFILDTLKQHHAKASFFCIGKNVAANPGIFQRILEEGHAVGNHSYQHKNGWKVSNEEYYDDIAKAKELIGSNLFRPPYGKIRYAQIDHLKRKMQLQTVMWTVLSGDFDPVLSGADCLENVIRNMLPGSIILFHDSAKAYEKVIYALPLVLKEIKNRGWVTEKL
jgi:peptidoglycan-N-acetylglucosamine deacetylase